jgi:hypothetical protein
MTLLRLIVTKGLVRIGFALGLFAMVFGLSAAFATTTHASSPPATFYGTVEAGDVVGAWIGSASCGDATADGSGFWMMTVGNDAACSPVEGDTVSFTVNGATADQTDTWKGGGAPADAANGITLTVTFTGAVPAAGSIGLLVTGSAVTAADLVTALGADGCTVESISVLPAGAWLIFINGAPSVVNAAFPVSLAAVTPFFVRCAA